MPTNATAVADIVQIINGNVFFVVGAARSGTTWLQLCLNGHPEICCAGEGHFIDAFAPRLNRGMNEYDREIRARNILSVGNPDAFVAFDRSDSRVLLACAIALLLKKNAGTKSCRWLGEKTPDNVLHMQLLADLFPQSRFIHIVRDGRDAAVSAWLNNLRVNRQQTIKRFGDFRGYAPIYAASWSMRVKAGREFGTKNSERYLELFYEDLHTHFDQTLRSVLEFLDVDASDGAIQHCKDASLFSKYSGQRARGEEDRKSHFRKGEIGDWKNHFDDATLRVFLERAGGMLEELGYVSNRAGNTRRGRRPESMSNAEF